MRQSNNYTLITLSLFLSYLIFSGQIFRFLTLSILSIFHSLNFSFSQFWSSQLFPFSYFQLFIFILNIEFFQFQHKLPLASQTIHPCINRWINNLWVSNLWINNYASTPSSLSHSLSLSLANSIILMKDSWTDLNRRNTASNTTSYWL